MATPGGAGSAGNTGGRQEVLAILLGYGGATAAPRSVASRCAARGGPRRQGLAQLCRGTATWLGLRGCLEPWAPWHGNPGGGQEVLPILLGYGGATAAPRSVASRCAARGGPRRQGLARLCLLAPPGGRAPLGGKNLAGALPGAFTPA